jgi:hypothetical protein
MPATAIDIAGAAEAAGMPSLGLATGGRVLSRPPRRFAERVKSDPSMQPSCQFSWLGARCRDDRRGLTDAGNHI